MQVLKLAEQAGLPAAGPSPQCSFMLFVYLFETGSLSVGQDVLKLT